MPSYNQILSQAQQLLARRKIADAEPLFKQVLALRSRNVDAMIGLGLIYNETKRHHEAIEILQQAAALQPYSIMALANLGTAHHFLEQHAEAVKAFRQCLTYQPNNATNQYNLACVLKAMGELEEAAEAFRRAIELKPDYIDALFNLGNTLRDQKKPDEAIETYERALKFNPNHAESINNLGNAWRDKGDIDRALEFHRKAMALKPDLLDAVAGVGHALRDLGRPEESLAPFQYFMERKPGDQVTHSGYLLALEYLAEQNPERVFAEHVRWGKRHANPESLPTPTFTNDRTENRRLRIGYLSPDFRQHAVAFFLENLLTGHDRSQVEVICYSTNTYTDAVTERFKGYASSWREVARLPEPELAELIRNEKIDILVDVAGHTAGNRLLAVARRPAPVQVSYLGYIDTTGMSQMDYRLVDAYTDPPGMTESLYTEELLRLPSTFACFRPYEPLPEVAPLPALANGHVTFGVLSVAAKINMGAVGRWGEVLTRVPGSRLIFGGNGLLNASVQERILGTLAAKGVGRERVEFFGSQPLTDYFALHGRIDILLDPFPVTGHTITCNALWMGVPVITLAGRKYVSRLGVSVMSNLQLPELIAKTWDEYVASAAKLAGDLPRLGELRRTMRERMRTSLIMDAPAFVRNVEAAYREMWRKWCQR